MTVWQELGPGVFRRKYDALRFNVGAVIGGEGVMVIDSRSSPKQAQEIISDLKELTNLPVTAVVNTHYHWDHAWGNSEFPGIPIWGHDECANVMRGVTQREIEETAKSFGLGDELDGLQIVPPDRVFPDSASVDLGGRTVYLKYLGLAHTNSDIVIDVPAANVIFGGDIIEEGAPPWYGDSFPLEWPDAMVKFVPMVAGKVVVPGHGDLLDASAVKTQADEIAAVAGVARSVLSGALTEDEAAGTGPYPAEVMRTAFGRARVK